MRKVAAFAVLAVLSVSSLWAQSSPAPASSDRKVVDRVAPVYPDLAKKMRIQGTVRIEAVVKPNGSVKSTRVIGGNPVLVEAASDAVKRWKFSPTQLETTEVVQLTFTGQDQ